MKLEGIAVCVNYGDFLNITLEHNRKHFDKIVIVTVDDDQETIDICRKHDATVVITDRLYENGDKFNKGKAINDGLKELDRSDWVLITDADMVMTDNLRDIIEHANIDNNCIYGTSRFMCPDYNNWANYINDKSIINTWSHQNGRINIGVGYFQLVNGKCDMLAGRHNWYREDYGHCGRSDRAFFRMWPPERRGKIGKASCIHLGNEQMTLNWYGRTTARFC